MSNCNFKGSSELPVQQGGVFWLAFSYKEDEEENTLPEGCEFLIGLWDAKGELIASFKTSEGQVVENEGIYRIKITHEISKKIVGAAFMEITVYKPDLTVVDHATDIVKITFDQRRNNKLLS